MVRALLRVRVKALAIVAAHALGHDDLRAANGASLTRLLADAARTAFGPALDPEYRQVRHDSEECPQRTEEPAVGVAYEDRCDEQRPEHCQEHWRTEMKPEHPEGLDVRIDE